MPWPTRGNQGILAGDLVFFLSHKGSRGRTRVQSCLKYSSAAPPLFEKGSQDVAQVAWNSQRYPCLCTPPPSLRSLYLFILEFLSL